QGSRRALPSWRARGRKLDITLARHLRSVGDAGPYVDLFDPWIIGEHVGKVPAAGEQIEDQRYPDPMPANAWLAEADVGIDRDSLEKLFARHGPALRLSSYRSRILAGGRADHVASIAGFATAHTTESAVSSTPSHDGAQDDARM